MLLQNDKLCRKLLLRIQNRRKFYQEISFLVSLLNNFHIIQFYFQFPLGAHKKLWLHSKMLVDRSTICV